MSDHENDVMEKPETKKKIGQPRMWAVRMWNDDKTPMDFVTNILTTIFNKSLEEAEKIMLDIHRSTSQIVSIYPKSVAETKMLQTQELAKKFQFPLKVTMEVE